jgi:cytidylate kinase
MLAEVERYAPPEPPAADVDKRVGELRAQAGSQFDQILQQTGMSLDQLRRSVRDDLRIDAYLQQRFGPIAPSEQDILQYYREHAAEFPEATFDQAHDRVRAALVAERRAGTIRDWVAGLRRRANINVLPR